MCQELLLRGQKDEHEKVCLGRGANPKAAAAAAAAAAARAATKQAKLAALGARAAQQRPAADAKPAGKDRMGLGCEKPHRAPVTKENAGPNAGRLVGLTDADIRRGDHLRANGGAPGRAAPAHPRKAPALVPPAVSRVPAVPS